MSSLVGGRVVAKVNNLQYGQAIGFTWSASTPQRAIHGIDSPEPQEIAPTTSKVSCRLRVVRTIGDAGAEGAGMACPIDALSRGKHWSFQLVDRVNMAVIFGADKCSTTSQEWSTDAKGVMRGTISFDAPRWTNEIQGLGTPL